MKLSGNAFNAEDHFLITVFSYEFLEMYKDILSFCNITFNHPLI